MRVSSSAATMLQARTARRGPWGIVPPLSGRPQCVRGARPEPAVALPHPGALDARYVSAGTSTPEAVRSVARLSTGAAAALDEDLSPLAPLARPPDPARSPRTAANSNDLGGRGQDTNRGRLATYSTRIAVADDGAEAAQPNGLQGAPSMGHRNGRSSLIVCWEPAPRGAMPGKRLLGLGVSRLDGAVRCCARRSGSRCRGRWFTPGYGTARPGQIWKRRHATGRVLDPACTSSASTACAC
jgi:hypothetical protein